jgi:hypothetical protein
MMLYDSHENVDLGRHLCWGGRLWSSTTRCSESRTMSIVHRPSSLESFGVPDARHD